MKKTIWTKHSAVVPDLPRAWGFVMDTIDLMGDDPSIEISPVWVLGSGEDNVREFKVTVSGHREEDA